MSAGAESAARDSRRPADRANDAPRETAVAGGIRAPGVRVVLDVRPLQDPQRAPTTAIYLEELLRAFDAEPLAGESFAFLLQSDLDDPTAEFERLAVVGRRLLPPTRLLRSGAAVLDPFLLTGATLGAAWRAGRGGAAGAVYHAAAGVAPAIARLPTIVTLLDLGPWELPERFGRGAVSGLGIRLRTGLLRHAAAVIVGSTATALAARDLLRIPRSRLRVIPLAPRAAFVARAAGVERHAGAIADQARHERERLGLGERYFVYSGRFDARHDLGTLLDALGQLGAAGRPRRLASTVDWPPRVLLVGASPDDRAALARRAARQGLGEAIAYAPRLEPDRLATLVRGARAALLPVRSEAAGLAAIEALACGTPVLATAVGPLPEIVGQAGILVPPRDPDRLAVALLTIYADDAIHRGVAAVATARAREPQRTWGDVAAETRALYAEVGIRPA